MQTASDDTLSLADVVAALSAELGRVQDRLAASEGQPAVDLEIEHVEIPLVAGVNGDDAIALRVPRRAVAAADEPVLAATRDTVLLRLKPAEGTLWIGGRASTPPPRTEADDS